MQERPPTLPHVLLPTRTAATLMLAFLLLAACSPSSSTEKGPRAELVRLLASRRPLEGRLSLGDEYRACRSRPPFCEHRLAVRDSTRSSDLLRLRARVHDASPASAHLDGLVGLALARNEREFTATIARLEEAWKWAPEESAIANDLAVAYLSRSELSRDPLDGVKSLEWIQRALALDPEDPSSAFNRALTLERLSLHHAARSAWCEVASEEPSGGWRREANERCRSLGALGQGARWRQWRERALRSHAVSATEAADAARSFPTQVRVMLEDELLPRWGEHVLSGHRAEAATSLDFAGTLASALAVTTGDASLESTITSIRGAREPAAFRGLAYGHRAYGQARALHEAAAFAAAARWFAEAEGRLRRQGSPHAEWASFYLAVGRYQQGDYAGALSRLSRIEPEGPVLRGYLDWMIALIRSRQARFEDVLTVAEQARQSFDSAGEVENVVQMDLQIASTLHRLGRPREAWRKIDAALAARRFLITLRREQTLLSTVGRLLLQEGEGDAALLFFREWVSEAERSGNPIERALARANLASALADLALGGEALEVIQEARFEAANIEDALARKDVLAELGLVEGGLLASAEPARALEALIQAESFAREAGASLHLIRILRSRAVLSAGTDPVAAARIFESAMSEIERQRDWVADPSRRVSFLDVAQETVEEALVFDLDHRRFEEAFDRQERFRAHVLEFLLQRRGFPGSARALREIQGRLSEDEALLAYLLLDDRLVVFMVSRDRCRAVQASVERQVVDRAVRRWVESLRHPGQPEDLAAARWLGRLLLPAAGLQGIQRLIVVPHRVLHGLPFAALPVGEGEGRLIDAAAVLVSPSAGMHLDLAASAAAGDEAMGDTLLLVGNPAFSMRHFPRLSRTKRAALQVLEVARRNAWTITELSGSRASASRFLQELPRHRWVVFIGHGIPAASAEGSAGLLLAPDDAFDDGFLSAERIARVETPVRTRLVVLASCGSAAGRISSTEGALSVARPFFAMGVPSVVATLWDVEELAAGRFLAELVAGGSISPESVQSIQRRWARSGEPVSAWAVFQWMGSGGERSYD